MIYYVNMKSIHPHSYNSNTNTISTITITKCMNNIIQVSVSVLRVISLKVLFRTRFCVSGAVGSQ